ncbi:hypothetical protein GCM10010211_01160 [Streptomyces albospinus]|uniref:Uncharacterized protein n=1 Tax=Streptomyces albospinus TaxID=285515 RepID=A0ABQ2ULU6_9ACTN|nr:hypothetical protein GCM10010211_01160 [Streptomyces albospinus]
MKACELAPVLKRSVRPSPGQPVQRSTGYRTADASTVETIRTTPLITRGHRPVVQAPVAAILAHSFRLASEAGHPELSATALRRLAV